MDDLESRVERTIDEVIRFFDPKDPLSYDHWDRELEQLGEMLVAPGTYASRELLFGSILAQRIYLAFEIGRFDRVVELSTTFVGAMGTEHPSSYVVLSQRVEALHMEGLHSQELAESLAAAKRPSIRGREFLHLLAALSKRHPGCVAPNTELVLKATEAVSYLQGQGYQTLKRPSGDPDRFEKEVCNIAAELNRINRTWGDAVIAGESP